LMYSVLHLAGLGSFNTSWNYWSSSETDLNNASIKNFYNGMSGFSAKNSISYARYARAIRSFTIQPETFKWKETSGAYSADINLVAGVQTTLTGYDIKIAFGSESGHVVADKWEFAQGAMRGLSIMDSAGEEYLEASAGVLNVAEITTDLINLKTFDDDSPGYTYLPNGIIIQWGHYESNNTAGGYSNTFAITFPTACHAVEPITTGAVSSGFAPTVISISASGFYSRQYDSWGGKYIAIGY